MKKYEYFIGVPASVLRDKHLSLGAKTVMTAIYDVASFMISEDKSIRIDANKVSEFLNCHKLECLTAFQDLQDYGYVELSNDLAVIGLFPGVKNESI